MTVLVSWMLVEIWIVELNSTVVIGFAPSWIGIEAISHGWWTEIHSLGALHHAEKVLIRIIVWTGATNRPVTSKSHAIETFKTAGM